MADKRRDPLDDPRLWQPMACPVCVACFRDMEHFRRTGQTRCYFGGPFSGYVRVP